MFPIDEEKWLASRGRTVRPVSPPAKDFLERLKFVAGLVASAPAAPGAAPRLLWRNERREVVSLALRAPVVIGRETACDLTFADPRLSRRHCRVTPTAAGVWVEDLGSTNGTQVNGRPARRTRLRDGDVIAVGNQALAYVADGGSE